MRDKARKDKARRAGRRILMRFLAIQKDKLKIQWPSFFVYRKVGFLVIYYYCALSAYIEKYKKISK